MRGVIVLPMLNGAFYSVYGGMFVKRPPGYLGVKMAVEINRPCDVSVPVVDFSIPTPAEMELGLSQTVKLILSGSPVYVGCAGGIGRTGLMLAVLAKAWGVDDPISYVRSQYFAHAVETKQQIDFVSNFKVSFKVRMKIAMAKVLNFYLFGKSLTVPIDKLPKNSL